MAPSLQSPVFNEKLSWSIHRSCSHPTSESESARTRVLRACDRCRMKKNKCDGTRACARCKADNAICVFGVRKRSHEKVYPKGYVRILEHQQAQLVAACQELYLRAEAAGNWTGAKLEKTSNGKPLTHDILVALNLLSARPGSPNELDSFEEDPQTIQDRRTAQESSPTQRSNTSSLESSHSDTAPSGSVGASSNSRAMSFEPMLEFNDLLFSAPVSQLVALRDIPTSTKPQLPCPANDPLIYQAPWAFSMQSQHGNNNTYDEIMDSMNPLGERKSQASYSSMKIDEFLPLPQHQPRQIPERPPGAAM